MKKSADEIIGEIKSGSFAPTLGYSIAFGYIKSSYAKAETEVQIDTGRKKLSAKIIKTPFYTNPTVKNNRTIIFNSTILTVL